MMYSLERDEWVPNTKGTKVMSNCHLLSSPSKSVIPARKKRKTKKKTKRKTKKKKKSEGTTR